MGGTTESGVRLRDDVTEGYNIIPNFFISAKMDMKFDYSNDGIDKTDRKKNKHKQVQFKNRLFDRDTLLLFHYDVNFLLYCHYMRVTIYHRKPNGSRKSGTNSAEKYRNGCRWIMTSMPCVPDRE